MMLAVKFGLAEISKSDLDAIGDLPAGGFCLPLGNRRGIIPVAPKACDRDCRQRGRNQRADNRS